MKQKNSEAYPEQSQTSKMELFVKIVKSWNLLTIFKKSSILDVRLCSEYASEFSSKQKTLVWRETDFPNTHEKSTKSQRVSEWCRCSKCGKKKKNVECLYCHEVEAVEYFELLDMRYGDINAITQRV